MYKPTHIVISYFTANDKDWVTVHTPYNPEYVREIKTVPTAHYDIEEKSWCCEARYGDRVEEIAKRHFSDIPLDIQEYRSKDLCVQALEDLVRISGLANTNDIITTEGT